MNFRQMNANPTGRKTGDCVVRALAVAEDKGWLEVYDALCKLGRQLHEMPNSKKVYEIYLFNRGWTKQKMPKHASGKRYTVRQLAEEKGGNLIVHVVHHLTAIKDGDLHDIWNCAHKCVGNYYTKG